MEEYKIGDKINKIAYSYDDQGNEYRKTVKGKICQVTKHFIVVDNGKFKESYSYDSFKPCEVGNMENVPYDLALENYREDIVNEAIEDFHNGKEAYVFSLEQLEKVIDKITPEHFVTRQKDKIYYIKKKNL